MEEGLHRELFECAEQSAELDRRMERIHRAAETLRTEE